MSDVADEIIDAFYKAKDLMKPQEWSCRSCRTIFVVAGLKEPETCPSCGSFDLEPELTGA